MDSGDLNTEWVLHPQLAQDCRSVADLALSRLFLMDDANYPWLVLVPRVPGASEIVDLTADGRATLMGEIALASEALRAVTTCHKLNVGALGNMVPQLHVHVVARFRHDAAWPNSVWGQVPARPYAADAADAAERLIASLRPALAEAFVRLR